MTIPSYDSYESNSVPLNNTYKFVKNIQAGSFGTVSLAENIKTGQLVSIKAISKTHDKEENAVESARNEVSILKKLGHQHISSNICALLDTFEIDSHIILVLEYCSNGDLYDLIHKRALSNLEIHQLCNQLYGALSFAHSYGIYHRDVKPENILIDENGNFKLCDWGLATDVQLNQDFNIGTEKYIAPELIDRISPNEYVDSKLAEYWTLGITLLTCIFGTSPFKSVPSIMDDSNFKKFVQANHYSILYDIYPSMNSNLFSIIMNLLKCGSSEDDIKTFGNKLAERSIEKFIEEFNSNWEYGFYIDDYEDYEPDTMDLFAMDHDDLPGTTEERTASTVATSTPSLSMPSLVESTIESSVGSNMSWLDMDDEEEWQQQMVTNMDKLSVTNNAKHAMNTGITIATRVES